jgi:curved DNA-binding protein CbpA
MSAVRKVPDPYRLLGVNRGADAAQIKAAHRRLAKRHHPDAPGGDEDRFVAVQEAYQLLSDPLRRREWDRSHAPGPVDARDRGSRASARAASARWTREDAGGAYRRTRTARGATGAHRRDETAAPSGSARGSDREPGTRRATWSAEGVPWWEDFTPKGRASRAAAEQRASAQARAASEPRAAGEPRPTGDMDAFSRSSGAAWSSAARRHFRRDEATLPSRGAFRYRGTQVVTGAEARKVAEEEAAAQEAAAALFRRARAEREDRPPPRAFDHDEPVTRPRGTSGGMPEAAGVDSSTRTTTAAAPLRPQTAADLEIREQPSARPTTAPARPATVAADRPPPAARRRASAATGALVGVVVAAVPAFAIGAPDSVGPAIILAAAGAIAGGLAGWLLGRSRGSAS